MRVCCQPQASVAGALKNLNSLVILHYLPHLFRARMIVNWTGTTPSTPFRSYAQYKEMGTIVMGKSESGLVTVGDKLLVMPNKCALLTDGLTPELTASSQTA